MEQKSIEDLLSKAKEIIEKDYDENIKPEIMKNMYDIGKTDGFNINHHIKDENYKITHIDLIKRDRLITSNELKEKGIEVTISETLRKSSNMLPYKADLKFHGLFLNEGNPIEEFNYDVIVKSYVEINPHASVKFRFKGTQSHLETMKNDTENMIKEYIAGVVEGRLEVIKSGEKLDHGRLKQTIDLMEKYDVMSSQRFNMYVSNIVQEASTGNAKSLAVLGEIQKYLK